MVMDKIALALLIVGGLNWGCIGLFQFDLVAFACGGSASLISRIIYTVVGLSAVWCISLLFRDTTDRRAGRGGGETIEQLALPLVSACRNRSDDLFRQQAARQ